MKKVDSGEIISVIPTPVFITDDLETLARRHYENEIYVLSNFEEYLNRPVNPFLGIESGEPHKRMPLSVEKEMVRKFEEWKNKYGL
jgi:phosphoribosylglycinamide formyltransferase-1